MVQYSVIMSLNIIGGSHMSEWDFLWGLKGKELEDAMSTGMDEFDREFVDNELQRIARKEEWEKLKLLRDSGAITMEDFRNRKREIFPVQKRK